MKDNTFYFTVSAVCANSGDIFHRIILATCHEEAIDDFLHSRPSAICIVSEEIEDYIAKSAMYK